MIIASSLVPQYYCKDASALQMPTLTTSALQMPMNGEDYFQQVIAEKFIYEKQYVTNHLRRHGIYSLLTTPAKLSIDIINKYLEIKAKHVL